MLIDFVSRRPGHYLHSDEGILKRQTAKQSTHDKSKYIGCFPQTQYTYSNRPSTYDIFIWCGMTEVLALEARHAPFFELLASSLHSGESIPKCLPNGPQSSLMHRKQQVTSIPPYFANGRDDDCRSNTEGLEDAAFFR